MHGRGVKPSSVYTPSLRLHGNQNTVPLSALWAEGGCLSGRFPGKPGAGQCHYGCLGQVSGTTCDTMIYSPSPFPCISEIYSITVMENIVLWLGMSSSCPAYRNPACKWTSYTGSPRAEHSLLLSDFSFLAAGHTTPWNGYCLCPQASFSIGLVTSL